MKTKRASSKSRKRSAGVRRGRGRPRGETPRQRERLLDAALSCYASDGIAATSVRRIAAAAGVTPALVNYYFGSKEQLLDAVVEERLLPVVALLRESIDSVGQGPQALATGFVHGMHGVVARHPWLPSLWVREILNESGALRDLLFHHISPQVPRLLAERFAAAQRQGALSPDVDPRLLVVSLIGLTLFPLAAAPIWRRLFDAADIDGDVLLRHTQALLAHGFGAPHAD